MRVLLDGDILLYEISFAAESLWKHQHKERGEEVTSPPPWECVEIVMANRIEQIVAEAGGEGKPFLFFTGKNNFRNHIAVTQPYKERTPAKPFHYYNVKAYLMSEYEYQMEDWLEADDLIGIAMTRFPGKYICATRDKDLRQLVGHHYGWEVGKQPSFGPEYVDEVGWIELAKCRTKCTGTGGKFFHYQLLMGDSVDTIPGCRGVGAVGAFNILSGCTTLQELEEAVCGAYKKAYKLEWLDRLREVGRLINMIRERDGEYVKLWNPSVVERTEYMHLKTGEIIDKD